ncbi:hypothetical protein GGS21DRAFT_151087 [Xylaria nigripes]|nr:hypothetical protein GGS21DRAFT_151087 [Xylaria nigripes]
MTLRVFSRGFTAINHAVCRTKARQWIPSSRFFSAEAVSHPSNLVQVYISRSKDPYLNLSIEHFLLQKSPPDSVILLLYTNRPCIVIGRNQNPWVEVNLGLVNQREVLKHLRRGTSAVSEDVIAENAGETAENPCFGEGEQEGDHDILLVRRRSGGGTVYHDTGNVNYSVICPPASFDRNKHAEMVVRALQGLKKIPHGVRVNERHDIVLDVTDPGKQSVNGDVKTYKISGSAYKLTRNRSLHHGTCLLSSPSLHFLSQLLRSPAAPYIKARGVESVRSPVCNVGITNAEFEDAVVSEFLEMYEAKHGQGGIEAETLNATDVEHIPEVQAGVAELKSRDWIYAQTPQFSFSSHLTAHDPRPRPDLPTDLPAWFFPTDLDLNSATSNAPGLQMTVRHAQITEVTASSTSSQDTDGTATRDTGNDNLVESLRGLHLHNIDDWRVHLTTRNESLGRWLNRLFGVGGEKTASGRASSV